MSAILDPSDPVSPLSAPPAGTAVMLLDYHTYLFQRISEEDGAKVIEGAKALRAWAQAHNVLIIHGLIDTSGPIFPTFKSKARIQSTMDLMHASPEADAEHAGIAPAAVTEREVVLKRTLGQFSAMKSRGLGELLIRNGIRSLLVGGISTSGCAMRTALQAADDGFIVTLFEDACADPLPQVHKTVLESIVVPNVHVTSTTEWEEKWKEAYAS